MNYDLLRRIKKRLKECGIDIGRENKLSRNEYIYICGWYPSLDSDIYEFNEMFGLILYLDREEGEIHLRIKKSNKVDEVLTYFKLLGI